MDHDPSASGRRRSAPAMSFDTARLLAEAVNGDLHALTGPPAAAAQFRDGGWCVKVAVPGRGRRSRQIIIKSQEGYRRAGKLSERVAQSPHVDSATRRFTQQDGRWIVEVRVKRVERPLAIRSWSEWERWLRQRH
jgi:hypothetical protein